MKKSTKQQRQVGAPYRYPRLLCLERGGRKFKLRGHTGQTSHQTLLFMKQLQRSSSYMTEITLSRVWTVTTKPFQNQSSHLWSFQRPSVCIINQLSEQHCGQFRASAAEELTQTKTSTNIQTRSPPLHGSDRVWQMKQQQHTEDGSLSPLSRHLKTACVELQRGCVIRKP